MSYPKRFEYKRSRTVDGFGKVDVFVITWRRLRAMELFTQAYITCALWSSTDDDGEPLDDNYDESDLAPETLEAMKEDCAEFVRLYAADIEAAKAARPGWYDDAQAGHDFWLTRNRHGAGFWDRGIGAAGDRLTEAAKSCGSRDLYVGDDGKVYQA